MKRWFVENLGMKALALLIALGLWAYAGSRQVLERRITLRLELTDIPAGMSVDPDVRTTVPVQLTGRKEDVLNLDTEELKAVVSLKGVPASDREVVVNPIPKVQPTLKRIAVTASGVKIKLVPEKKKNKL